MPKVLVTALLLCGVFMLASVKAETPWIITSDDNIPLATNARDRLKTEYFELGQWKLLTMKTKERYEEWFYNNTLSGPGVFGIDAHKAGIGDFNGDGHQDILINWATFPHTIERAPISPSILLNEDGHLRLANDIWATEPPARMFSYKVGVADFNRDGTDDVVLGSFGVVQQLQDGGYYNIHERVPLMVSDNERLIDASDQIEGQETGLIDTFRFAHDLAVGDVNGDGFTDFYQGWHLFLGDGDGAFTVRNDLLPAEARLGLSTFAMSSAIGDLDGDGVGDLVVAYADGQPEDSAISGWIFLSDQQPDLSNAKKIPLPDGRYGLHNTKHNSMTLADIDDDGRLDILIGQTKADPYYEGRVLQVLMNRGDDGFVDETDLRMAAAIRPEAQGEGITFVMDINGDGYLDIVDSAGGRPNDVAILVNDGAGFFERIPTSQLPIVQDFHLAGLEGWEGESYGIARTMYIYPIDLDGNGIASFVVQMELPAQFAPADGEQYNLYIVYSIKPTQPIKPAAVPRWRVFKDTFKDMGSS